MSRANLDHIETALLAAPKCTGCRVGVWWRLVCGDKAGGDYRCEWHRPRKTATEELCELREEPKPPSLRHCHRCDHTVTELHDYDGAQICSFCRDKARRAGR